MQLRKVKQYTGHKASIYKLQVWNDRLLSVGGDGYIVSWPLRGAGSDGELIARVDGQVFALGIVSDDLLAVGDMNGHLYWVDTVQKTTLRNIKGHNGSIYDVQRIGDHVYTCSADGSFTRWNTETMLPEESLLLTHEGLRCILPYDQGVLIGTSSNEIIWVDLEQWSVQHRWAAHSNSVFCLTKYRSSILSGGRDALLKSWQVGSWKQEASLEAHWFTINDIMVLEQEDLIATASRDKTIRLWDAPSLQPLQTLGIQQGGHINSVNNLAYSGELLFSTGDDRSIIVWEVMTSSSL